MSVYQGPILGFDVASYSRRSNLDQSDTQRLIQDVLEDALRGSGDELLHKEWVNFGDGGCVAMQGHIQIGPKLLALFSKSLRRTNAYRRPDAVVDMRHVLHFGTISVEQGRLDRIVSGDGINDVERMLSLMPRDRPGQVVISDAYRKLLVENAGMRPDHFQPMPDLEDKHGKIHVVWNFRTDDFGV